MAYALFENGHGAEDCYLHYKNCIGANSGAWGKDEERELLCLAMKHDLREWERVSEELGTCRSAFLCLKHYQQCLSPTAQGK